MKRRLRVYLAGPMLNCTKEQATAWRNRLKNKYKKIEFYDPCEFEFKEMTSKVIVKTDLKYVKKCDVVVANVWKISAGTVMEIAYAWWYGKTIVILAKRKHVGAWLQHHSTICVETEKDLDKMIEIYHNDKLAEKLY